MHDYRQNFEVKNSSGWNSSDVGDALVLLTAVVGAIFVIVIL
jgi:hypothetical protein